VLDVLEPESWLTCGNTRSVLSIKKQLIVSDEGDNLLVFPSEFARCSFSPTVHGHIGYDQSMEENRGSSACSSTIRTSQRTTRNHMSCAMDT
jgi:hypothetical protein